MYNRLIQYFVSNDAMADNSTDNRVQGWSTEDESAVKSLLAAGEYKLSSESDNVTPHIQSFAVNSTGASKIDRVLFEVTCVVLEQTCVGISSCASGLHSSRFVRERRVLDGTVATLQTYQVKSNLS